ncbi:hypothetical protein BDY19DRAFT_903019 [Irpex rosettiformis]|uniref:Uncharacterized protein n=1 Tax=Irpex rosettiformis TaxID=378272 RepID=A0ACB8UG66_9APHY|nr:hypothetical protein BDY19DRAFT_903019 [Irpex rosettiformis]
MKVTIPFVWLVLAVGLAEASSVHAERDLGAHARLAARHRRSPIEAPAFERRGNSSSNKRCKPKASPSSSSAAPAETQNKSPEPVQPVQAAAKPKTTSSAAPAENTATTKASGGQKLLTVSSSCGSSGATSDITSSSGPNGSEDFLLCGLHGGGWNPAHVTVNDIVYKDLNDVLNQKSNPFSACASFVQFFYQYGNQYNLPPILIAAIAMQESSCQRDQVGGAGEQGLMQITKDKCEGRSPDACRDPSFNIGKGASYLRSLLDQHGGNVLTTLGGYNGMEVGATAGALLKRPACWQPNFDYLQQTLNGYLQGHDPQGSPRLGVYHNYDKCQG